MPPKKEPKRKVPTASRAPKVPVTDGETAVPSQGRKRKDPAAAVDSDYEDSAPLKRSRKGPTIPLRSPLPDRVKRVVNPGGPDLPPSRRTSEQVAAAARRKQAALDELAELEARKMTTLAQMELEEEEESSEEESSSIKWLADHERAFSKSTMDTTAFAAQIGGRMDNELEQIIDDFQMSEEEYSLEYHQGIRNALQAAGFEDAEEALPAPEPVKEPKHKKRSKGDTRNAVDVAKQEIRLAKKESGGPGKESKLAKLQALFPTGIDPNWRQQKLASGTKARPATSNAKASGSKLRNLESNLLGGLTDHDILSSAPSRVSTTRAPSRPVIFTGAKVRTQNRLNDPSLIIFQDVLFVDSSDDEALTSGHPAPAALKKPQPKAKARVKLEPIARALEPESSITVVASSPSPDIPAAITAIWDRTLIPTLLHALGSARDPWDFAVGETIDVLRTVYPTSTYEMKAPGNLVLKRARDRLNNGRSWFGTQALLVVTNFFNGQQFSELAAADAKIKIKNYVEDALRPMGPMLWSVPETEFFNVDEEGYQVLASRISSSQSSPRSSEKLPTRQRINYGFLVGALGLCAAALEKTFLMFATGEYINDGLQFSRDNVSSLVDDYLENFGDFSARKWETVITLCGVSVAKAQAPTVSAAVMSTSRRTLYISSSPVKAE
ncbi:hypothetical protein DFH09DRAFT_1090831 [Mycena vulgaris]|nr:hypothetical protein DFH09DRAFT_1090831 [Mycena vulgaris]